MKLRVGLVGLGEAWETTHRPALRAMTDRIEVRAVCAAVYLRAEQAAREFSAEAVEGFRALASRNDIDALLILSPEWFGTLPIIAGCESGKAVYCANTLDLSPREAEDIKLRVSQSGIAFMAEFPRRYAPATVRMKELIATRLGAPQLLFCHHRLIDKPKSQAAQSNISKEDRTLVELIDWCRFLVGSEPTSVVGSQHRGAVPKGKVDYSSVTLDFSPDGKFGEGTLAKISCGQYLPATWEEAKTFRPPAALQIRCEHGIAFIDLPTTLIWFDDAGRHLESLDSDLPVGQQLLSQFYRSVTSLIRKTANLEDTFRSAVILAAAMRSSETGQRQSLDSE